MHRICFMCMCRCVYMYVCVCVCMCVSLWVSGRNIHKHVNDECTTYAVRSTGLILTWGVGCCTKRIWTGWVNKVRERYLNILEECEIRCEMERWEKDKSRTREEPIMDLSNELEGQSRTRDIIKFEKDTRSRYYRYVRYIRLHNTLKRDMLDDFWAWRCIDSWIRE